MREAPDAFSSSSNPPRRRSGGGGKARLSIRLTREMRVVLERAAAAEGSTVAALCGQAVDLHARRLRRLYPAADPLAGVQADAVVWALAQLVGLADAGVGHLNRHKRDEWMAKIRGRLATLAPPPEE